MEIFAIFTLYESVLGVVDRSEFFFQYLKGRRHATNFVSYQTCLLGTEVSQDPLHRFSPPLHHMVGIELQMINPTFFFRYRKGRCHGNQFSGKMGQNYVPHALIALSFQKIMGYCYLRYHLHSFQ